MHERLLPTDGKGGKDGKKKTNIIKRYGKMEDWNTTNVTDMSHLFHDYMNFNEDISKWDTSNVTNMAYLFNNCKYFNQHIGEWDVSKVTTMDFMFEDAEGFNLENAPWYHE